MNSKEIQEVLNDIVKFFVPSIDTPINSYLAKVFDYISKIETENAILKKYLKRIETAIIQDKWHLPLTILAQMKTEIKTKII